jgi:hypothetical protein
MTTCTKCGAEQSCGAVFGTCRICGQDLRAKAAGALTVRPEVPWERTDELGFFNALWQTVSGVLLHPHRFFAAVGPGASTMAAWIFGLITGSLGLIGGLLASYLNFPTGIEALDTLAGDTGSITANSFIGAPLLISLNCAFSALYCHVLLAASNRRKQPLSATFRVACYAQAATLLSVVPVIGSILSGLWYLYVLITGLGRVHATSRLQTLLLLTLPLVILLFLVVLLVMVFVAAGIFSDSLFKGIFDIIR